MRTVAVVNEKGASAKTTTTISLAVVLAKRGLWVLVVDWTRRPPPASGWGAHASQVFIAQSVSGPIWGDSSDLRRYRASS